MNKKKLAVIICGVLCAILLAVLLKPAEEEVPVQDAVATPEVCDGIGAAIAAHLDMLDAVNCSMMSDAEFTEEELLLTVDGVPLPKSELELRKQLISYFPKEKTEKELLNRLIQEKVCIAIAKEQNIMPTAEEVEAFLQEEQQDEILQRENQKFCVHNRMTIEEYWNIYERYNVIRILALSNVRQYYLDTYHAGIDEITARSAKIEKQYQKQLKKWTRQADIVYYK